jgi:hypothetical protein
MTNGVSNRLQTSDRLKIAGWSDIQKPEVEQLSVPIIDPDPKEVEPIASERLENTKSQAEKVLDKIAELTEEVDKRCARFKVSSNEDVGSPLFQAMVRVFNEKTTTVTYDHYKRALEIRQQLAEEDAASLRLQ